MRALTPAPPRAHTGAVASDAAPFAGRRIRRNALNAPTRVASASTLTGSGVQFDGDETWLQQRLTETGFYKGAIDGVFGPQSRNALAAFERAYDIPQDGVADAMSMRTLAMVTARKNVVALDAALAGKLGALVS